MSEKTSTIWCETVVKTFTPAAGDSVYALRGLSAQFAAGSLTCIYGASGSGKSTLINCLAGLDVADDGKIVVGDVEVTGLSEPERRRFRLEHVGVVFQRHNLLDEFTALENVELPLVALGWASVDSRREAVERLDALGVSDLRERRPREMSGGQRQRVGVARAMVGSRRVILADEPTGSLDSIASASVYSDLRRCADLGACVVLATHDNDASEWADEVLRIRDGVFA